MGRVSDVNVRVFLQLPHLTMIQPALVFRIRATQHPLRFAAQGLRTRSRIAEASAAQTRRHWISTFAPRAGGERGDSCIMLMSK